MSNNYQEGYEAGSRGEQFSGSGAQAYAGYAAGKEAREKGQPQTHVDGVGFTALMCAQLLCMLYPIAGAAAIGTMALTLGVTELLGVTRWSAWMLVIMVGLGIAAFLPGFAIERRAARHKWYRILRDCLRLGLAALIPLNMLMATGRNLDGGAIAFSIVLIPIGYFIVKRIDRAVGAGGVA
jgi:hypothetical protein